MSKQMQWSKFYWGDWTRDAALRNCSYAAKGLWMDMLAQMDASEERGVFLMAGRAATPAEIARAVGGDRRTVERLLVELEEKGVFSRDDRGALFSRRMTRDDVISRRNAANGKQGGNPVLLNNKDLPEKSVNPPLKAEEELEEEKEAEKRVSKTAADAPPTISLVVSDGLLVAAKERAPRKFRLPVDWQPNAAEIAYARDRDLDVERTAADFRDYFCGKAEARAGWTGSWQTWCRKAVDYRTNRVAARYAPAESKMAWMFDPARNGLGQADLMPSEPEGFTTIDMTADGRF